MRLRPQVHRERHRQELLVVGPAAHDLRRERGGRPRVHDVRIAGEPARHAALIVAVAARHVGRRIDRQLILARRDRPVVLRSALRVERVPHRERHAEEPLTADAPVAVQAVGPVLEARLHVCRMPLQLFAARDQGLAELDRLDEPLPAGDDLERAVPLLVELHGMRDRPRLADEVAALAQLLDDPGSRLGRRQPLDLGVVPLRPIGVRRLPAGRVPRHVAERAVRLNHRAHRQAELTPPGDVGDVAERADHRDAAALFGIGERVRKHRHPHAEQRRLHFCPEQRLIPRIVGVRDQGHAGRDQLGPGRVDLDEGRAEAGHGTSELERDAVVRRRHLAILELGLRHRGLEVDVPQRRRFHLVGQSAIEMVQKRELRDALRALADRRVRQRPVDRETERLPQLLEDPLVVLGQAIAQLDEVGARHRQRRLRRLRRRLEVGQVRQRRVAAHAVVVLHAALGWQAVVVPPHRVKHRLAAHPLETGDDVGVGVREDVADVERAADGRRRRVDREHVRPAGRADEAIDTGLLPPGQPLGFEAFEGGLVGKLQTRGVEARQIRR